MEALAAKYPAYVKKSGPSDKRQVALTFDDGPDTVYTSRILDALKENHAKATFFLIGNRAEANPELVKRIADEGHDVGNHSYSHPRLPSLSPDQFQKEISDNEAVLKRITGHTPQLIRPPYSSVTEEQAKWLVDQKRYIIDWNADTQDWKQIPASLIETKVFDQVKNGSIIVMHSASAGGDALNLSGTVEALPRIIKRLRDQGLEPVTVSQLLGVPAYADVQNPAPNVPAAPAPVPDSPKSVIRLDSEDYSVVVGQTLNTAVTAWTGSQKKDVTTSCTFAIADPKIASVDRTGNITGLKRGVTVITATYGNLTTMGKFYVY
jgi:peptidoglycan/xylan/chitin deacetylase (PgdA/CDA1 family)